LNQKALTGIKTDTGSVVSRTYLSAPHMSGLEQAFVAEAFESNWMSSVGPNLTAFEAEFTSRIGLSAVALSSGTAALHLALRLLGVGAGDEVLCPTFTFVATANPVLYQGGRPTFVDSERESWNVDPNLLEDALRARKGRAPKAILVVHLFGQSANMDPILELSSRYGVPVIEDAAEALGTLYRGRPAGSFGAVSAFSFNGNKIITTTSGGMLVARDPAWVEKARFWSTQARDPGIAYEHSEMGFNYRLSNVLAGIGRGQLRVLDQRVEQRRAIAFRYREAFSDLDGLELMPQAEWGVHTNWLSCFLVDEDRLGCSRDHLIAALGEHDVEARPVWKPLHLQPLYRDAETVGGRVAEDLFRRGICLPSSSFLDHATQARVIDIIHDTVAASRKRSRGGLS
jgi:pyridoxal phosphate-dependent aminotransferase EpsN